MNVMGSCTPKWFLADHGEFYGKEILNGFVFVPDRDSAGQNAMETVASGDLFLHLSPSGISAIGRANSAPHRVPVPFWRRRKSKLGERGYAVEVQIFLLPVSIPFSKAENTCLTALSKAQFEAIFQQISECVPDLANAGWIKSLCPESGNE